MTKPKSNISQRNVTFWLYFSAAVAEQHTTLRLLKNRKRVKICQ
jgi:hypothetical protein